MKKLSIFFLSILSVMTLQAQQRMSAVVITVNGNSDSQVLVDGTAYTLAGTAVNGSVATTLSSLAAGQHTLLVNRSNQNNYNAEAISTTFNLRNRYDMKINVNADGSLELIETLRTRNATDNESHISNADFNNLWKRVRAQRSAEQRRILISNAFSNSSNISTNSRNVYFTSNQIVQLLQLITNESARLQLAKQSYATVADPINFDNVVALFSSQASRNDLNAYVNNYNSDDNSPGTVYPGNTVKTPMTDANFNSLYQTARQQWPTSAQLTTLSDAFSNPNNYFTTAQASQLIQLSNFEANRLQLAKQSYRSITDPFNFSQLYNLLNSQTSKDELAAYVSAYTPGSVTTGTNTHMAMSDANFSSLIQSVRYKFLPGEKMNTLVGIFSSSTNYFSSAQAKQLIELVSLESNRLQLAKSAYRTVVDRPNFKTIYDLFDSQSSRNELDAYVYAYRD